MEDVPYALRDKTHIEETLRLATDDKSGDYTGRRAGGELVSPIPFLPLTPSPYPFPLF